ncbi:hypothetical protein TNCV_1222811 [Trichonephila clavipes]|nr:hypothetical protein TNCV_1222811 [Trichonephila clavipes]
MQVPEADRDPVGEGDFGIVTDRPVLIFLRFVAFCIVFKDERESNDFLSIRSFWWFRRSDVCRNRVFYAIRSRESEHH